MTNFKNNVKTRIISVFTIVCLFLALNASGALAGFWRTVNNTFNVMTSGDEVNFSYGYGYGDSGWGYGYGFGYGYGSYGSGYGKTVFTTTQDAINSIVNALASNSGVLPTQYIIPVGSVNITLPQGLIISGASNLSSLIGAIISNPSISGYTTQGAIEFGISGTSITFNKAVKIEIPVSTSLNGQTVKVQVSHNGGTYGSSGLATAYTTCTSGIPNLYAGDSVVVSNGIATIYTCAASKFVATTTSTSGGSSGGGGGGGGTSSTVDYCPNGDTSGSLYDGKCSLTTTTSTSTGSTTNSGSTTSKGTSGSGSTTDGGTENISEDGESVDLDDLLGDDYMETSDDGNVTITKADGTKVTFSDINNTFAKEYIAKLAALGIVNGYEDGTFRPERTASRAEYLKMVLRAMNIDYSDADTSTLTFVDVDKESWIAKVVVKAVELNMIDSKNTNFRPNDNISRAESMKMLLNAAGIEVVDSETSDFSDVNGWAAKYVQKAKELGIVNGQDVNGKLIFRPFDSITRAEVSKIVIKTMELK